MPKSSSQSSQSPPLRGSRGACNHGMPAVVHSSTGNANKGTLGTDSFVVVVAVFDVIIQAECLRQQTLRINCAGAFDGKELFIVEGSEKWRSTPDDLEEREKCVRAAEKPVPPPYDASKHNVQIFKCELRDESGTTSTMKYAKFKVTGVHFSRRNWKKFSKKPPWTVGTHKGRRPPDTRASRK